MHEGLTGKFRNLLTWTVLAMLAPLPLLAAPQADLIFHNGEILTMERGSEKAPRPRMLAVRGERIIAVGNAGEINALRGPGTTMIDLNGRALLPGFIDAHGHAVIQGIFAGWANLSSPPVGEATDISSLQAVLRKHIDSKGIPDGEWVAGYGYDDSLLAEGRHPTRDDLDAVSTEHPIALLHVSGHLMAANSPALEAVGITADSPDPDGGIIRRKPGSTEPDGVLEETASFPLRGMLTTLSKTPIEDLRAGLALYASHGITTTQEGGSNPAQLEFIREAAAAGAVIIDLVAYPVAMETGLDLSGYPGRDYENRFRVGGVKLVLDGSPQGKTAFMTRPYLIPPHGQKPGYLGYPMIPPTQADKLFKHYLSREVPIIAHANGDAAIDMLIHGVANAAPGHDHRTVVIHAQTARDDQLDDMQRLALIPSFFSAHSFYWGDWHRDSVFGPDRALRISPLASALIKGVRFTVHNDAPVVPPDMLRLIWASTNRQTRSGKILGAGQRISTFDALSAVTRDAAYQYFEEDSKGTLTEGKLADLVILSADPLAIPESKLLDLRVEATYARGTRIFQLPGDRP